MKYYCILCTEIYRLIASVSLHFKNLILEYQQLGHPAPSVQTVRLPVWPWQQVCVRPVRKGGGASNMNIHYDVTGLLTVVWRSHSGQIVWPAGVGQGRGGFWTHSTYTWYPGSLPVADNWIDADELRRPTWLYFVAKYIFKSFSHFLLCKIVVWTHKEKHHWMWNSVLKIYFFYLQS